MRYVMLVTALLVGGPVAAQEPDTLDPAGYFPLSVGNEWEYAHYLGRPAGPNRPTDESRTEYLRYRIVDDEFGPDADRFALVEERFTDAGALLERDTVAVEFDPETASVLGVGTYEEGGTWEAPYPGFAQELDVPIDSSSWEFYMWHSASRLPSADALPDFLAGADLSKTKQFVNIGGLSWASVHGFGFVRGDFYGDGCSSFCPYDTWSVTFAVIDGVTYGARAVGVESALASDPTRLRVYPNPAHALVRVEARSPRNEEVEVYDVIGRRVRSLALSADGTATLDLGEMAPGLYVVRVGGDARRLVLR